VFIRQILFFKKKKKPERNVNDLFDSDLIFIPRNKGMYFQVRFRILKLSKLKANKSGKIVEIKVEDRDAARCVENFLLTPFYIDF
jgi:hypothetical protein